MKPLFTQDGLMILESLSFTKTLYAFDFDGTLSKIVSVPTEAKMSRTTQALLQQLALLAPIAIISGRGLDDLHRRLPFQPHYLIGNHGLEGLGNNQNSLKDAEQVCKAWKGGIGKGVFDSGIELEDKTYSLALHLRRSRNKKKAKLLINRWIQNLSPPPRVIAGKSVINLLPSGAPHKGMALLELMKNAGTRHAFYIGDDDTDEDVFSLREEGVIMTVRVGEKKTSHARYFIDSQSEINRLLKYLIRFHSITQKKECENKPSI